MDDLNIEYLQQMLKIIKDISLSSAKLLFCESCAMSKAHK